MAKSPSNALLTLQSACRGPAPRSPCSAPQHAAEGSSPEPLAPERSCSCDGSGVNQGRSKDHIPRETASAPSTRPPRVPVPPPAPWRWPVGEAPQHRGQDAWRRAARGGCSRASGGPRPQRSAALAPAPPRASRPQRCRRRPPQQGEPALRAEEGQGGRPREARRCCPAPAPQGWGRARRAPAPCSTSRTGRGLPGRGWGGSSSGVTGTLSASARGAAPPSAPSLRRAFPGHGGRPGPPGEGPGRAASAALFWGGPPAAAYQQG